MKMDRCFVLVIVTLIALEKKQQSENADFPPFDQRTTKFNLDLTFDSPITFFLSVHFSHTYLTYGNPSIFGLLKWLV